ncbi:MAG: hypothetical protein WCQ89_11745 [Verrucomicrobiota bacterium]
MPGKSAPSPLLYTTTDRSSDALYFGRVEMPDALAPFGFGVHKVAVVSASASSRVRRTSNFDVALELESYLQRPRGARVGVADHVLRRGAVVTVETDLHYPALGACRMENVAQVTPRSPQLLSRYHSNREIS